MAIEITALRPKIGLTAPQFSKNVLQRTAQLRPGVLRLRGRARICKFVRVDHGCALPRLGSCGLDQAQFVVSQELVRLQCAANRRGPTASDPQLMHHVTGANRKARNSLLTGRQNVFLAAVSPDSIRKLHKGILLALKYT